MTEMDPNEAFRLTIRAERSAKGMTMQQLADESGVSLNSLKNYLNRGNAMGLDTVKKLGDALGLSRRELMQMAIDRMDRAAAHDSDSSR